MKKFEVEAEVLYVYAIEAEDRRAAIRAAQSIEAGQMPCLERTIESVSVKEVNRYREPGHFHKTDPPGMCANINWTPQPLSTYEKLEKIAEAHNVDIQYGQEAGHDRLELWGRREDLEKMKDLLEDNYLDDYLIRDEWRPAGADDRDVLYLYSDKRVRWDKLGY